MATFTVDELVKAAEQLPQTDLENLTAQVLTLKAKRAAPELSKNEAELLWNINRGMPDALQNRYRELIAIRRIRNTDRIRTCRIASLDKSG